MAEPSHTPSPSAAREHPHRAGAPSAYALGSQRRPPPPPAPAGPTQGAPRAAPAHGTAPLPCGTPEGLGAASGDRRRGNDRAHTWRATARSAPPGCCSLWRPLWATGCGVPRVACTRPSPPRSRGPSVGGGKGWQAAWTHHALSRGRCQEAAVRTRRQRQAGLEPGVQRASSSQVCRPGSRACMQTRPQRRRRGRLCPRPGMPRNRLVTQKGQEVTASIADPARHRGKVTVRAGCLCPHSITYPLQH
jgi:hypothetical protein